MDLPLSDPYPAESKTRRIPEGSGSPSHGDHSEQPFCPYSLSSLCLLFVGVMMIFSYFESILISFEWSYTDNYIDHNCQPLKPINPNIDLSSLSPQRKERFEAVQHAVRHAWKGYTNIASLDSFWNSAGGYIPHDDLSPMSRKGNSWLHYAATLHDSIDTLYLANMTKEYDDAVFALTAYDIQTTSPQATKTFEYSLRVLGGLLGGYSVSGDPRLFAAARNAADAILEGPFQASPSILPRPFNVLAPSKTSLSSCSFLWDWKASIQRLYKMIYSFARNQFTKEHQTNSLAGFGSFGMEFAFISNISRDHKYRKVADDIFYHVQKYEMNGLVPYSWNVLTGEPRSLATSLGSGSDSFYEYLIKIPTLNRCSYDAGMEMYTDFCEDSDKDHLRLYEKMVKESLTPSHVRKDFLGGIQNGKLENFFPVDSGNQYDHLLCFLPGMLSLGASTKYPSSSRDIDEDEDQILAEKLLKGCASIYKSTETGLSPDRGYFGRGKFATHDSSYYLRPEYVESLFVLYRNTKDEKFQEMAWDVFQSLEKFCKIESGGYASLKDVNDPSKGHVDDMPSFFLAETLKYLLLIFAPDDYISLEDFVFTTEAHPLRKPKKQEESDHKDEKPFCALRYRPPTPMPYTLVAIAMAIIALSVGAVVIVWKCARKTSNKTKTS